MQPNVPEEKINEIETGKTDGFPFENTTPQPEPEPEQAPITFETPKIGTDIWGKSEPQPFETQPKGYDDDDVFINLVEKPAFIREQRQGAIQNKTQVMVEETVSTAYYEMTDDVDDVFRGFAD